MGLGFGLISCQRSPGDARSWEDLYREALDLTSEAERLGFDSVWTTEHHFVDDGYMPSLLAMSAAMAARTRRIHIGTGVVLAPLHHPLRIAEDAATVQIISGGRFILGLGLGWSEIEFDAFGAALSARARAMDEYLSILNFAWQGRPFRHEGEIYAFPEIAVRPAPATPIPIVVGGGADAAIRRAGRLAGGIFSNAAPDRFLEQVEVARRAIEDAGRDAAGFRWLYYTTLYPSADAEAGWDEIRPSMWLRTWKYRDMGDSASRRDAIPDPPPLRAEIGTRLRAHTVVGPAEHIVAHLVALRERAGVPVEFVTRSYFPDFSYDRQVDLMGRLATEVAPCV